MKGDSIKFSISLNVNNSSKDSLFVQDLNGVIYLDSLFEIPVSLKNPKWLSPGGSQVNLSAAVQLDFFKILALPKIKKLNMQGIAFVALEPGQKAMEIDFNETRDIPPSWMEKYVKTLLTP
jgi:hypothetical protein